MSKNLRTSNDQHSAISVVARHIEKQFTFPGGSRQRFWPTHLAMGQVVPGGPWGRGKGSALHDLITSKHGVLELGSPKTEKPTQLHCDAVASALTKNTWEA